jgi:hypothetical protein
MATFGGNSIPVTRDTLSLAPLTLANIQVFLIFFLEFFILSLALARSLEIQAYGNFLSQYRVIFSYIPLSNLIIK